MVLETGRGFFEACAPPVEQLPLMKGDELASSLPSSRDKERRFVISHRSEEALGQDLVKTVFWIAVAAAGAFALGAQKLMPAFRHTTIRP